MDGAGGCVAMRGGGRGHARFAPSGPPPPRAEPAPFARCPKWLRLRCDARALLPKKARLVPARLALVPLRPSRGEGAGLGSWKRRGWGCARGPVLPAEGFI